MKFSCFSSLLVFYALCLCLVPLFFVEQYHKIKLSGRAGDLYSTKVMVFSSEMEVVGNLRMLNVTEF